jgi:hypothetical protein
VQPEVDDVFGVAHCVTRGSVRAALHAAAAQRRRVVGVLIVSPTYFGAVADVAGELRGKELALKDAPLPVGCRTASDILRTVRQWRVEGAKERYPTSLGDAQSTKVDGCLLCLLCMRSSCGPWWCGRVALTRARHGADHVAP